MRNCLSGTRDCTPFSVRTKSQRYCVAQAGLMLCAVECDLQIPDFPGVSFQNVRMTGTLTPLPPPHLFHVGVGIDPRASSMLSIWQQASLLTELARLP